MSEEPLQRAEQAIKEGREAAEAASIMPVGDPDDAVAGRGPDDTGGAVAAHGEDAEDSTGEPGEDAG